MTVLTDKIEKISVSPSFLSGQDVQCKLPAQHATYSTLRSC